LTDDGKFATMAAEPLAALLSCQQAPGEEEDPPGPSDDEGTRFAEEKDVEALKGRLTDLRVKRLED
jgi:hypothetical protein